MTVTVPPPPMVSLGGSPVRVPRVGVGTWAWGDKPFWGYARRYGPRDLVDAFVASTDAGATFFDTAEVYGHGESEKILGWLCRKATVPTVVATKFGLLPGRDGARSLRPALGYSLRRLGVDRVDLYQIHWPDGAMASVEDLMAALADTVDEGVVRAVGVSNFSAGELRTAHAALARRNVPLATQQVHYGLLHRAPERDGVLDVCRDLGITLLAYSPLEQGILAGAYRPGHAPAGPRGAQPMFAHDNLVAAQPVVDLLQRIGAAHGGCTPAQVALAWTAAQTLVIPLAGARNGAQAAENAGALHLVLTPEEIAALDTATRAWR